MLEQAFGDGPELRIVEVRRDLEHQGHVAPVRVRQAFLLGLQFAGERAQFIRVLQLAQVLGIGRRDVHRDITCVRIHFCQAELIVVGGTLDRRVEILANVDTQYAAVTGSQNIGDQLLDAMIIESQAVDQGLGLGQAEHARFGIARLRPRCNRADLDEAKSHGRKRVDVLAVLVQAGGETERIGKLQTHEFDAACRPAIGQDRGHAGALDQLERSEGEVVRDLGIHPEQKAACQGIQHGAILQGEEAGGRKQKKKPESLRLLLVPVVDLRYSSSWPLSSRHSLSIRPSIGRNLAL